MTNNDKILKEYIQRTTQLVLYEEFLNSLSIKEYACRAYQQNYLLESDLLIEQDNLSSTSQMLIDLIKNDQWETPNQQKFLVSLQSGKRSEMLTPYSFKELGNMELFKVKDFNAGFAIKSDGDIVAVHNNAGIPGIGGELIKASKRNGGIKLDHFDGFLSGFYSRFGFKISSHDPWNDDYSPSGWKYEPIDFFDPQYSIYAVQANSIPEEQWPQKMVDAKERYDTGKPDIIYRHL